MDTLQSQTLHVSRLIKAPASRVFSAWISAGDIKKWFGPSNCQVLLADIDARVGGDYHVRIHTDGNENCEAGELDVRGQFREFKAPSRLVYTWNWSGRPEVDIGETVVSVDFIEVDDLTQVRLVHEGLPDEESLANHEYGWSGSLDKLESFLSSNAECRMAVGEFSWNELLTKDVGDATRFYGPLFGWQAVDFPSEEIKYTLFKKNGKEVGGLMKAPDEHMPAQWLAYVTVANIEATAKEVSQLGGTVIMAPFDVPNVGRIAVFKDPQNAVLGLFQPMKDEAE